MNISEADSLTPKTKGGQGQNTPPATILPPLKFSELLFILLFFVYFCPPPPNARLPPLKIFLSRHGMLSGCGAELATSVYRMDFLKCTACKRCFCFLN